MNRFIRPNRQQTNAPGSSQIDFAAAKKPVLLDPGLYRAAARARRTGRPERQHQRCLDAHRHRQRPGRQHQADVD